MPSPIGWLCKLYECMQKVKWGKIQTTAPLPSPETCSVYDVSVRTYYNNTKKMQEDERYGRGIVEILGISWSMWNKENEERKTEKTQTKEKIVGTGEIPCSIFSTLARFLSSLSTVG